MQSEAGPISDVRILIVEDESIVAMDLEHRLKLFGYTVIGQVIDGKSAVELARTGRPDLVLMDIQLHGPMDGIEAAGLIIEELDIPVIFLTAYADRNTLNRAKVTEAFGYILKPYQERELYTNIEIAIYKHRLEHELKENRRWLNTTLTSITDGVIAAGNDENIRLVNPEAERITGHSAKALEKESLRFIRDMLSDEETISGKTFTFLKNTNTVLPVEVSESPILDNGGTGTGRVMVLRDITRQYTYEMELHRAKIEAEFADRAKGEFLATISHELRTPLNSIIGLADLSADNQETEQIQENLDIIRESGKGLLNIINSILQFTRMETAEPGTFPGETEVELLPLMRDIVGRYYQRADCKGVEFSAAVEKGFPETIISDADYISEILRHLLENACKFTSQGSISLTAAAERSGDIGEDREYLRFEVRDTGIGIPAGKAEYVFTPFVQADNTYTRTFGGLGIGLTIVKKRIEQLQGRIWFTSEEGTGTVFTVQLPSRPGTGGRTEERIVLSKTRRENGKNRKNGKNQTPLSFDSIEGFHTSAKEALKRRAFDDIEKMTTSIKRQLTQFQYEHMEELFLKLLLACRRGDYEGTGRILDRLERVER